MKIWEGYQKGIDFGGWFSQCDYSEDRFDNFMKEEDFANVSSWGLDHIRLPIDYNLVEDENGEYIEKGFARIEKAIEYCGKYGLNMVLDLHKTAGYSFDAGEKEDGFFTSEAYQERFYKLWEELAKRFGKYSDRVSFELLNEVTDKAYMPTWTRILTECIKRIRAIVPDVYILIGGYWNNSITAVPDLPMPYDDHIVYNFHCYDPLIFTHQGAYWVDTMPQDYRVSFDTSYSELMKDSDRILGDKFGEYPEIPEPDKKVDARFFRTMFSEAIKVAKERNVPLYCGEYGVINLAAPEDALKWYKAINEVFVENGIGRAAWNYREMDFGFVDEHFAGVLEEIKKYL